MGNNLAILWPGETSKPYKGLPEGRSIRPRLEDVDYARERMPELDAIWGELTSWRTALTYGRKTVNGRITGTIAAFGPARKHYPQAGGRFLNPQDEDQKRRVAFFGDELARDVFGPEDPLGKTVLINNSPFTVIGVMQRKKQSSTYGGPDKNHALIPQSTFKALFGKDRVNVLVFRVKKADDMPAALVHLNQVLGPRLGFDPEDTRVWGLWNTVEGPEEIREDPDRPGDLLRDHRRADAHHRRRGRREHHVRRRQGAHQGDRGQDGPGRAARLDHGAVRARGNGLHVPGRTVRGADLDRHRHAPRVRSRSRATTSWSFSASPRCPGRSAWRRSRSWGPAACSPATSRRAAPRRSTRRRL